MIQLATDPNASRLNWRPAADDGKETSVVRRARSGHAWPFISRHAERAAVPQETKRTPNSESGS
jgi:hypothetical protein